MTLALPNDLLGRLSGWATLSFGLRFPPDRWTELARGVASAALELGIPDLAGWSETLVTDGAPPDHVETLANHLTISETYFFRHPETFTLLERDILPARVARRREQRRPLRIWSAGCASGEEPYSVAILIRGRVPEAEKQPTHIVGTDINSAVLTRARRGLYSEWSFRDTPSWVRDHFFKRQPNGWYQILPEIRDRVRFTRLNLASALYPPELGDGGDFDVILCRNVLMYFSGEWQARIIRRLVQALAPEGWLLVGPCDIAGTDAPQIGLQIQGAGTFQKTDAPRLLSDLPTFALPSLDAPLTAAPRETGPSPTGTGEVSAAPLPAVPALSGAVTPKAPPPEVTTSASAADVASARAQALADRGELDEALAACDEAIAADKTNPHYHYLRGCILQEQNRIAAAEEAFRRVLYLEPNSVMALFALGSAADRTGRRDVARHYFSLVLRVLSGRSRGEPVAGGGGLTVGHMQAAVEQTLNTGRTA